MRRRTKAFVGIAALAVIVAVLGTATVFLTSSSSGTKRAVAAAPTKKQQTPTTTPPTTTPPAPTPKVPEVGTDGLSLIPTEYPICAAYAKSVVEYVKTGKATADFSGKQTNFDTDFSANRAQILAAPEVAQVSLLNAFVNKQIADCNQYEDKQAADQAAAEQQREQQAAADAAEQARVQRYNAACSQHDGSIGYVGPLSDDDGFNGGSSDGTTCVVNYDGKWYSVTIDRDGQWTGDNLNYLNQTNQATCDDFYSKQAAYDASQGYPWVTLPQYHSDTGVCVPGTKNSAGSPVD
jgi:hypothetical protein